MNFIKKIVDGKTDELVHLQFQKFSRGEFLERAVILAKLQGGGKYSISTTPEFGNELVLDLAEKLGEEKTQVKGAIISTVNLKEIPEYSILLAHAQVKQFQGVKRYIIDVEMSGNEIKSIVESFPKAFFGLSFKTKDSELKIKPKAPKSGKPSSKGEDKPKADFCKLKTTDASLAQSFVFEKPDFKEAEISHTFFIEKIEIPEELKNSKDFAKIREESFRVGKIVRKSKIDGIESKKEIEFKA